MTETTTLWRPIGQAEMDLVEASGRRQAWPQRPPFLDAFPDRRTATTVGRERCVPAEGVAYVTRFDVERAFIDRFRADGRYRIPAGDIDDLNAHLVGPIIQEADYRAPVGDHEFAEAEQALGRPLPAAWRRYLQGPSWFRRGFLTSGAYVWLNTPSEMLNIQDEWDPWDERTDHPGLAILGGNGSREQLAVDLRTDPPPVLLIDISSNGWHSAIRQTDTVEQLIERIESGEFTFNFDE